MDKYFFPLNYKYSAKFLGIIEYNTILPIACLVAILIGILYIAGVDFFVGFAVVIVVALPLILLLSVGVNGEPIIPYLKAMIRFKYRQKIYIYKV